ncbi:MAG: hypothetical protein PSV17_09880 [Methylotenera sp.]|uniref:hypothetical protein n=1 Tax=Methylotenera sp. TaxID=2051956 RepID=UPI002488DF7E|nr:hypothetical protein [Methylotenera sp.]MDI1309726.1 hypothetical protein [Methylotenera sp.]
MYENNWEGLLQKLTYQLTDESVKELSIIPFASPIISFGDYKSSIVATMGLNPSDKEFLDALGGELSGIARRFHTLSSLGLNHWGDASSEHLTLIQNSCESYFSNNPYNIWFRDMENIISGTGFSLYKNKACHLDLIPYATYQKWGKLGKEKKNSLLGLSKVFLENVLVGSSIKLIVLNGQSVVDGFQKLANIQYETKSMSDWTLYQKNNKYVNGVSFRSKINNCNFPTLNREILVLGFNHNLQSSFGVSSQVKASIKNWITESFKESK